MANPIMQALSARKTTSNPLKMISQFRQFAADMTPEKAEQEINRLLSTGEMTQEQFTQLQEQAKAFMQFLG